MNSTDIAAVIVFGIVAILLTIVLIFGIKSAEKTEEKKRALMEEVTRYYKKRNEMFEKEDK